MRFAPAPTGYLHLGSARTALFNWLAARSVGGTFLLRIEDTDLERSRPELVDVVFEALEWMGLDWDEPPVRQSARLDAHQEAVEQLLAAGLAYWSDPVAESDRDRTGGRAYDVADRDRGLGPGAGRAVRFRVDPAALGVSSVGWQDEVRGDITFDLEHIEDFVIRRADGSPTFFIANVVDDVHMRVTDVIRGEDLVNVTPKYLLLRRALGAPVDDLRFAHLPLIVNEQRKKLSKRRDDVSLLDYRDRGFLGEAMVNHLALLGWGPPDGVEVRADPLAEFPPVFRIADVGESSATFDVAKLRHIDAEHIRALGSAHFLARSRPFLEAAPWAVRFRDETFAGVAAEVQVRVETLAEVPDLVEFLFVEDPPVDESAWAAAMTDDAGDWLRTLAERMVDWPWRSADLHERTTALADELGVKLRRFQTPLRVALTGRRVGLPLFESMEVLGREECLRRVGVALARLEDAGS